MHSGLQMEHAVGCWQRSIAVDIKPHQLTASASTAQLVAGEPELQLPFREVEVHAAEGEVLGSTGHRMRV